MTRNTLFKGPNRNVSKPMDHINPPREIWIDLDGPEGNLFFLLSRVKEISPYVDTDPEDFEQFKLDSFDRCYTDTLRAIQKRYGKHIQFTTSNDHYFDVLCLDEDS